MPTKFPERILVTLNDAEVDLGINIGKTRFKPKENFDDPTNGFHSVKNGDTLHIPGALAELAVAKYRGWDIDRNFYGKRGDDGVDFVVNGSKIDVKAAQYSPIVLKFNSAEHIRSDWIIGCYIPEYSKVWICGYVSAAEYINNHYKHDYGHGERLCLKESQLRSMKTA